MKEMVLVVKDLGDYLHTVIKPILETPGSLKSARELKNIGLRPRELVGLFLICVVGRHISKQDWTISSDPDRGDGVIICNDKRREGEGFAVEQVYIPSFSTESLTEAAISAISEKSSKGKEYGKKRHLVVFCDKHDRLDYTKIKENIASNDIFTSYWIVGKYSQKDFVYLVITLKATSDPPRAYAVRISRDFRSWGVEELGRV